MISFIAHYTQQSQSISIPCSQVTLIEWQGQSTTVNIKYTAKGNMVAMNRPDMLPTGWVAWYASPLG
jgi:hypothetical protein